MPPYVIAHRGDSDVRPENTLSSFSSALQAGAEVVECDVQLTKDGHVVVMHDAAVDRTTNGSGRLADLTLAEVRKLSAGYPQRFGKKFTGERVPTLVELLAFLRERARILIEIKPDSVTDDEEGGIEARTIAEVRKAQMEKDVALISFSRRALLRCRDQAPEITRGHLFHRGEAGEMLTGAREVASDLVMPSVELLSEELRDRAREAGIKVATWVVDSVDLLRDVARFDLYGVATNKPSLILDAVREINEPDAGGPR
jgi:glycerophosphoryl diester phosphodiesterase